MSHTGSPGSHSFLKGQPDVHLSPDDIMSLLQEGAQQRLVLGTQEFAQFRDEVISLVSKKEDVRAMCHLVVQVYTMSSFGLGLAPWCSKPIKSVKL